MFLKKNLKTVFLLMKVKYVYVYVRTPSDECPGVRVAPVGNDRLQVIRGHQIFQIKIFNDFDGAKSSFTY